LASIDIIINASNLKKGGGIQVALSFMSEAMKLKSYKFHFFLNRVVNNYFVDTESNNYEKYIIENIPTDSIFSWIKFNKELNKLERLIDPLAVITVFGPCYWKPRTKHIMGFAVPYYIYNDTQFFKNTLGNLGYKHKIKKLMHKYFLKNGSQYFWVETNDAKSRFASFLGIGEKNIVVANNNASNNFFSNFSTLSTQLKSNSFKFLYVAEYYPHKNHSFISRVVPSLLDLNKKIEFFVTLQDVDYENIFGLVKENVINLGRINPVDVPAFYKDCDAVFMPSVLEVFSAVYLESMISKKPLIVPNLPFARDICGEAALYYDYDSLDDAVEKIKLLVNSEPLRDSLIEKGLEQQKKFDTPEIRFEKVLNFILLH